MTHSPPAELEAPGAWPALWALALGFFMMLVDGTIVSVAIPAIMSSLDADVTQVIWVSSAYLLTYAVPLLISGRLGDRFGPKRLSIAGLGVFTLASLWCGLSGSIESLIAARAVQGLGAALMSPQTMAVITRLFPPHRRGAPMGLWGVTASVASLIGPVLGGLLIDSVGWRWIFFVNIPVGVVAIGMVWRFVPKLETHAHRFDIPGVVLNAVGLTLIVFGVQEGQSQGWPAWIWGLIAAGVAVLAVFVWQQARTSNEPLMPLALFSSRNFSAASVGIFDMGAIVVSMSFPMMLYLQTGRGLSPTQAALLGLPQALVSLAAAPIIGKLVNSRPTKPFVLFGFITFGLCLLANALLMDPDVSVWWFLVPSTVMGLASSSIWGPLSMSATRDLPVRWAGAGSGVYNATRQLGSVLGSAAIAAIIAWQLEANLPGAGPVGSTEGVHTALPDALLEPFSLAMRHAAFFPAVLALLGVVAASFLVKPVFPGGRRPAGTAATSAPD